MKIDALTTSVPEYKALDEAIHAYWALDVENNDVPEDMKRAAIQRCKDTRAAWIEAARAAREPKEEA